MMWSMRQYDYLVLFLLPLIATIYVLLSEVSYLLSIILFFVLPALYLSLRQSNKVTKTTVFSLLFSVPAGIITDYVGTLGGGWYVPISSFSIRIAGILALENYVFIFFVTYLIILFYEHFFDLGKQEILPRKLAYLFALLLFCVLALFPFGLSKLISFAIPYAYLWLGIIILLLPVLAIVFETHIAIRKFLKTGAYFGYVALLYLFTGVQFDYWIYPGKFIGWVTTSWFVFPVEELVFWVGLMGMGILAWYEFFDDDER